jgi:hypothetical protein
MTKMLHWPTRGPVTIDAGACCEFCERRLVRVTIRWLTAATLSDYCEQSPTMFHRPAGAEDSVERATSETAAKGEGR